ncbi:MAG: hypothetical protein KY468_00605 [Armatimonadetes bacterium]|nr:hypothetical protein [Armatimonadota bacterium]
MIHGLDEVLVNDRSAGFLPILLLPVIYEGRDPNGSPLLPQPPGHLVAIHTMEADVKEDHAEELGRGKSAATLNAKRMWKFRITMASLTM